MMPQEILVPIAIISSLLAVLIVLPVLKSWDIRKLRTEQDKLFSCIR